MRTEADEAHAHADADADSFFGLSCILFSSYFTLFPNSSFRCNLHCTYFLSFHCIYSCLSTMRVFKSLFLLVSSWSTTSDAFVHHQHQSSSTSSRRILTTLFASSDNNVPNVERMKELIQEEASDANMMKAAAEQMKNLTPDQIDAMIRDMETMNPIQKQALKALGMDPEAMKQTMQMMKENPQMMESAQKLMQNMTPEQMMEQSRLAQERMKGLTPEQLRDVNAKMSSIPKEQLDQAVDLLSKQPTSSSSSSSSTTVETTSSSSGDEEEDEDEDEDDDNKEPTILATGPGTSSDPKVVAAMYKVAEFMSNDSDAIAKGIGGVSLAGFASLPIVQLLSGSNEEDLSPSELKECWANGSLGATRVDQQGFERVWKEVQEYFEDDIMGEARKEAKKQVSKKKRGTSEKTATATTTTTSTTSSTTPKVGASMTEEQLAAANEQFKTMSDDDMSKMFESMQNMDPATEARLKAMGTDPGMLRQTAKLMNSNPLMRKAAKEMIKNMSGKDMLKVSQQAQEEMKKMSPAEVEAMMNMDPKMQEAMKNMSVEEIQEAMKGMKK